MASRLEAITPYLPQHEGLLPKWLLLVPPTLPSPEHHKLTSTGIHYLHRELNPSLHNPLLHLSNLLRKPLSRPHQQIPLHLNHNTTTAHQHLKCLPPPPSPTNNHHTPLCPPLRNLDSHPINNPSLCRVQHLRSTDLPDGVFDLPGCIHALHE